MSISHIFFHTLDERSMSENHYAEANYLCNLGPHITYGDGLSNEEKYEEGGDLWSLELGYRHFIDAVVLDYGSEYCE